MKRGMCPVLWACLGTQLLGSAGPSGTSPGRERLGNRPRGVVIVFVELRSTEGVFRGVLDGRV